MQRCVIIVLLLVCGPPSEAKYSGGSGSADDPYLLTAAQELVDDGMDRPGAGECAPEQDGRWDAFDFRDTTQRLEPGGWDNLD